MSASHADLLSPFQVPSTPTLSGPKPVSDASYPFSTARFTAAPVDLAAYGYVEEEYFLAGQAAVYDDVEGRAVPGEVHPYVTRVLVRRPMADASGTAWLSILNASQGYDIEDDWRRAWDFIVSRGDTYVGLTSKPLNVDALKNADPERYAELTWAVDGAEHEPVVAGEGWNPFQVLPGREEGLAWDMLAHLALALRSGDALPAQDLIFLIGQSQSAIYTNTFAHYFHARVRRPDGGPLFDGYLAGVGSVLRRGLRQAGTAWNPSQVTPVILDLDVPVITVLSEGDLQLFGFGDFDPIAPGLGNGPLARQYQVARAPHSDPRSRVIPTNDEIRRAGRVPRVMDQAFLEAVSVLPIEPVVTGAMANLVRWARDGVAAPASVMFDSVVSSDSDNASTTLTDATAHGLGAGTQRSATGGIRLGLLEHPLANFRGASRVNPVFGEQALLPREQILARYPDLDAYRAACDAVDDALEASGYLEATGRRLLHALEEELWDRAVNGAPASRITPQSVSTRTPAEHSA